MIDWPQFSLPYLAFIENTATGLTGLIGVLIGLPGNDFRGGGKLAGSFCVV